MNLYRGIIYGTRWKHCKSQKGNCFKRAPFMIAVLIYHRGQRQNGIRKTQTASVSEELVKRITLASYIRDLLKNGSGAKMTLNVPVLHIYTFAHCRRHAIILPPFFDRLEILHPNWTLYVHAEDTVRDNHYAVSQCFCLLDIVSLELLSSLMD